MTTIELISQFLADGAAVEVTNAAWFVAQANKAAADDKVAASSRALCEDLVANGPAVTVDTSTAPPTVTIYQPSPPDAVMPIIMRVAS